MTQDEYLEHAYRVLHAAEELREKAQAAVKEADETIAMVWAQLRVVKASDFK